MTTVSHLTDSDSLDQDLLSNYLVEGQFSGNEVVAGPPQDESPETDLLFGFSYEALVDDSHKGYFDNFLGNTVMV